ncbi:MAG: hypothetical protein GXP03_12785 [Alphaproteobacteria bacterium]|nr:hypothetical protein [Alphaproteobacteria bacterium]
MLHDAWMSAITGEPKTFNNCLSFEQGFWQPEIGRFSAAPIRRVFGAHGGRFAVWAKSPLSKEFEFAIRGTCREHCQNWLTPTSTRCSMYLTAKKPKNCFYRFARLAAEGKRQTVVK